MCGSPQENFTYEFVTAFPAVPGMSSLSWMVCKMGGKWPYSYCFVGCYFQDLFKTVCNILV